MQSLIESLIKQCVLYLELKEANAPSIILETEEKFINDKTEQLHSTFSSIFEKLKEAELDDLNKCSPCYICKNGYREKSDQYQPLKCSKDHLMDDNNIDNRTTEGCNDWDKDDDSRLFEVTDEKVESINQKYSDENLSKVIKFICNRILSK